MLVQLLFRSTSEIQSTSDGCCADADMPCDDYWIQRWTALVRVSQMESAHKEDIVKEAERCGDMGSNLSGRREFPGSDAC